MWALSPIEAPAILARGPGDVRLEGVHTESCWPQGDGELRCTEDDPGRLEGPALPRKGTIEVRAAYPVQPDTGRITIVESASGEVVKRAGYTERVRYTLDRGDYVLRVEARYPESAFVRYSFGFATR